MGTIAGALLAIVGVVGVLVPLVAWAERKQAALVQGRLGPRRTELAGISALGLLQPLADLLKILGKGDPPLKGPMARLRGMAPLVALIPVLSVIAVIPVASTYRFGDATLRFVVADPAWGLLYALVASILALYAGVIAGLTSSDPLARLGALRSLSHLFCAPVVLGLAAVSVFLVYQTLALPEMAQAQDATFRVFGFLEFLFGVPLTGGLAVLTWFTLPAWGALLQPLGFLLFAAAAVVGTGRAPFDAPTAGPELAGGHLREYAGVRLGLFQLADHVAVLGVAGLLVTVFLGGWSIPWLPQAHLVDFVARGVGSFQGFGSGFANGVCVSLHLICFAGKFGIVLWVLIALRGGLSRFRSDQVIALCWGILVPLAFLNIFMTAWVVLGVTGQGGN
ncbi:NADH-quinone oxidoreductase subunit H [Myxococcota bacterium]|nr:NADH-quinone oxidoreductase subunit H [Myxococcota bacterium]